MSDKPAYKPPSPNECTGDQDCKHDCDAYAAERVREARLDEAKWWLASLREHGDEIMESEFERIAQLEREKEKPLGVCDGERALLHERDTCEPGRACENWRALEREKEGGA